MSDVVSCYEEQIKNKLHVSTDFHQLKTFHVRKFNKAMNNGVNTTFSFKKKWCEHNIKIIVQAPSMRHKRTRCHSHWTNLLKNTAEDVHNSYDVARKNGRIIKAYKSQMNGPSSPESRKVN